MPMRLWHDLDEMAQTPSAEMIAVGPSVCVPGTSDPVRRHDATVENEK